MGNRHHPAAPTGFGSPRLTRRQETGDAWLRPSGTAERSCWEVGPVPAGGFVFAVRKGRRADEAVVGLGRRFATEPVIMVSSTRRSFSGMA